MLQANYFGQSGNIGLLSKQFSTSKNNQSRVFPTFYKNSNYQLGTIKILPMVYRNDQYLSNSLEYVYKPEIGQRVEYTANTGTVVMTVANTNLNGTGTIYTVLQSGSANGTLIKTITVKSIKSVNRGMVRIFIANAPGNPTNNLIAEIEIPARNVDSIQEAFAVSIEVDFMLKSQWLLRASIENASSDTVVIAEGLDISFP